MSAVGVLVVASVLLLTRLGDHGLRGDEGFYGLVVADLLSSEDGPRLTLEGEPFLNKPPLAFWLMALSASLSTLDEHALRLPGALVSLGLAGLVFFVGRRRLGPGLAALATLLFLSARHALYFHGWRAAVTEPLLVLLTLATVLAYCRIDRRLPRLGTLAALGALNGLTKGPVGPALAAATIALVALLCARRARETSSPREEAGTILTLAVACLPALLAYFGWWLYNNPHPEHLGPFLVRDWIRRATGDLQASHVQPIGYFFRRGAADFGLWTLFAIPALAPAVWRRFRKLEDREGLALLILPLVTLIGFSLSISKIAWYLYPAYPFFALAIAHGVRELLDRLPGTSARRAAGSALALLLGWRVVTAYQDLPRAPRASLVRLARSVASSQGQVYFDERLLEPRFEPREWNRFTLYHRLHAKPWRATTPVPSGACVYVVSPLPSLEGASAGPPVAVAPQARSKPEPPLFVHDLCRGTFSTEAGAAESEPAGGEAD